MAKVHLCMQNTKYTKLLTIMQIHTNLEILAPIDLLTLALWYPRTLLCSPKTKYSFSLNPKLTFPFWISSSSQHSRLFSLQTLPLALFCPFYMSLIMVKWQNEN